jgi:plastocyanin
MRRCEMHRIGLGLALAVGASMTMAAGAVADEKVRILDSYDPATFNAAIPDVCMDAGGEVTFEEFSSPNVLPEGHPAWRNPSYITIRLGEEVKVTNNGGEEHTFTEVVARREFIPFLNNPTGSTEVIPECGSAGMPHPDLVFIPSGGKAEVTGLSVGTHLVECCIHPWMRAAIKVVDKEERRVDQESGGD